MNHLPTTLGLLALTLLTVAGEVVALLSLRKPTAKPSIWISVALIVVLVGTAVLAGGRWYSQGDAWRPLAAHVDGLLLIGLMLAATVLLIHHRPRLRGLVAFGLPLLTVILAWGVCASAWTYQAFDLETFDPVWKVVHLAAVYLGTAGSAIAAGAGAMYLYVQKRLKSKQAMNTAGPLASLEALEALTIRAATLGFALLTLGLASGMMIFSWSSGRVGNEWWASPKVWLAIAAWLVYCIVMNARHAATFRGARAAWLAIGGLILLLATYGIVTAWPEPIPVETSIAWQTGDAAAPAREVR